MVFKRKQTDDLGRSLNSSIIHGSLVFFFYFDVSAKAINSGKIKDDKVIPTKYVFMLF